MRKLKGKKSIIIVIIILLLLLITYVSIRNYIIYSKSDKYKVREFTSYISKNYSNLIKLNSVTIDSEKKQLSISFNTKKKLKLGSYNAIRHSLDLFKEQNPQFYEDYIIEIWLQDLSRGTVVCFSNLCYVNGINDILDTRFSNMKVTNDAGDQFSYITMYTIFTDLQTLQIEYLTIDSLDVLKELTNLRYLCSENSLTKEDQEKIRKTLPNCEYRKYHPIYTCPSAIVD